jgi:hypothetical protein
MRMIFDTDFDRMIELIKIAPTATILSFRSGKAHGMVYLAEDLGIITQKDSDVYIKLVADAEFATRKALSAE